MPKPFIPDLLDDDDADAMAETALSIDDSLSLIERVERYTKSEHDLHRLFVTKMMPDAAQAIYLSIRCLVSWLWWLTSRQHHRQKVAITDARIWSLQDTNYHIAISTIMPLLDWLLQEEDNPVVRQGFAETLGPLAASLLKVAGKCESPEIQPAKAEIMTKCLHFSACLLVDDNAQVREAAGEALVALSKQWDPQAAINSAPP